MTQSVLVWSESVPRGKFLPGLSTKRSHVQDRHVGHPGPDTYYIGTSRPPFNCWTHNSILCRKVFEQRVAQAFLLLGSELGSGRSEIKDVDGSFPFCFNQCYIDVAFLVRER